jgi:peptide-methionine (S)-S-oxide reductase
MFKYSWSIAICLGLAASAGWFGLAWATETVQDSAKSRLGGNKQSQGPKTQGQQAQQSEQDEVQMEIATFGNGCFWCTEAVFLRLKGVLSVKSGYSGGQVPNPTYEQICTGMTGHAEVVQIEFNPNEITFDQLLEVFWATHDPTTLNRQGPDIGTQYRSAVFYHNEAQKQRAELAKSELDKSKVFKMPIVTEITEFSVFYPAEDYHQNFFARNPNNPYCQVQAVPKIRKIKKVFADLLKEDPKR